MTGTRTHLAVAGTLALTFAAGAALFVVPARSQTASPDIAFVSARDGNREIYVMNADGSGVTNLTATPAQDDNPAWSPDGSQIVFDSDRTGAVELFVMRADGSHVTQLTYDGATATGASWSPDGTRVAFASNRDGYFRIYVVGVDGMGLRRLTDTPASDTSPSWSPDGQQIAFRGDRAGTGIGQIYVMNADGTNVRQITFGDGDSANPSWSPDGARIVFSNRVGLNAALYAVNPDGFGLSPVTRGNSDDTAPVWSPDGARVAFSSNQNNDRGICVVVVESGFTTCLTQNNDTHPSWAARPTVARRSPIITWANPGAIVLGTALGDAQLNATADVPGQFSYTPPGGTILPLGLAQRLSVVFTPDDPALYSTATAAQTVDVLSGSAAPVGMVVGRVTDAATLRPLAGIDVWVYDATGRFTAGVRTGADGAYASPVLPPGAYFLRTFNNQAYIDELYDDVTCLAGCLLSNARAITVLDGATATGTDFRLQKAFAVSGHVRDSSTGLPLAGVSVDILDDAGTFISSSWTNAQGLYTSTGLPEGSYRARTANDRGYQELLYAGVPCIARRCDARSGMLIPLGPAAQPSDVDFALDMGGRISGVVRRRSGDPLANVSVQFYTADGALVTTATTDASGTFLTAGLPPGPYRSRTANSSGYVDAVFGGGDCLATCNIASGALIAATAGATTSGADFQLAQAGLISGRVVSAVTMSPLSNVEIDLYSATGMPAAQATTANDGSYAVAGLPPGTYFARSNNTFGWGDKIYNGLVCPASSCNSLSGNPIVLAEGTVRNDVDFALDNRLATSIAVAPAMVSYGQTVTLSARLMTAAGTPVVNRIVAFTVNGAPVGSASTTASGIATLGQVPVGDGARLYTGGIVAAFGGDVSYQSATSAGDLLVNRGTPLLTWQSPSRISYGTPLGELQLHATASVAGTFVYRPPFDTVLPVGANQTLTTTFFPSDGSNYASVSATASITVDPSMPPTQPTFQVLHNFAGVDGANPDSVLRDAGDGSLVGTTPGGGLSNAGVLYLLAPDGAVTPTYAFNWGQGALPAGGVKKASDGYFYGTTSSMIYRAASNGDLVGIAGFTGSTGSNPSGGVVQAADGSFYGVATYAGAYGVGTIYRLDPANVLTAIHSFSWPEGAYPSGGLIQGSDGFFYGTTMYGGSRGMGTAYRMDVSGAVTLLHSFSWNEGAYPQATLVLGSDGNLYGTTNSGGVRGMGTVFRLDSAGRVTVLHAFQWDDGANPLSGIVQASDGYFYGTTSSGGRLGAGTVYRIDSSGVFATVHDFMWTDGASPHGDLTELQPGIFYGTTYYGGTNGVGTIFRMTRLAGADSSQVEVLAGSASYGGTANLSFTVTSAGVPLAGEIIRYDIDGSAAGVAVTGPDGVAAVPGASVAGLAVGNHSVNASFFGDQLRAGTTGSSTLVITPATPVITWQPTDAVLGTPLGAEQMNASANVPGIFTYMPPAGTVLPAGPGQALAVVFTPADMTNYTPVSATRTITVNKLSPQISWNSPQPIAEGTPLDPSLFNAVSDVPGAFEYSPGPGAVLGAGPGQILTATFTPADAASYLTRSITTTIDVEVPEPLAAGGQMAWEQRPAPTDTVQVGSALYLDGIRIDLGPASCVASPVADLSTCSVALPSITPGTHKLELASYTVSDSQLFESARSRPLFVAIAPPVESDR